MQEEGGSGKKLDDGRQGGTSRELKIKLAWRKTGIKN